VATLTPGLIAELAGSASSWSEMEHWVLAFLERDIGADTLFFLDQSGPTDSCRGVLAESSADLRSNWTTIGRTKAPGLLVRAALARDGVVVDSELFGTALREQQYYRAVMAPVRGYTTLFGVMPTSAQYPSNNVVTRRSSVDTSVNKGVRGEIVLGRCSGSRPFTSKQSAQLASLLPTLTLAHRALLPTASVLESSADAPSWAALTLREREVLSYLHLGYTNRQIGVALGTKERTVRNQLSRAYEKLGVGSRAEAVGLSWDDRPIVNRR
jgi:DNA-binding CsgD family transcriptional regulator